MKNLDSTLSIRLTKEAHNKIVNWADQARQRKSDFVRDVMIEGLKHKEKIEDAEETLWPKNNQRIY